MKAGIRKNVKLKRQRNGNFRNHWYGRYNIDGKTHDINLNVKWEGTPPASGLISDSGDQAFEISRNTAQITLANFVEEAQQKGNADHLVKKLIESKTGQKVENKKIEDLATLYGKYSKAIKQSSDDHIERNCSPTFQRFTEFMKQRNPEAKFLQDVTQDDADAFVSIERQMFSKGTAQHSILRIRNTFTRELPSGVVNHFERYKYSQTKGQVINRVPFTPAELVSLIKAAQSDPFMYPLIVTAMGTGQRQGDICNLKWSSVDLAAGVIKIKTSKTISSKSIIKMKIMVLFDFISVVFRGGTTRQCSRN
jgi:hypothetical protein